jgi:hypothetical protein
MLRRSAPDAHLAHEAPNALTPPLGQLSGVRREELPRRLGFLATTALVVGSIIGSGIIWSYPMVRDLERTPTVLAGIAGYRVFGASIALGDEPAVRASRSLRPAPLAVQALPWLIGRWC